MGGGLLVHVHMKVVQLVIVLTFFAKYQVRVVQTYFPCLKERIRMAAGGSKWQRAKNYTITTHLRQKKLPGMFTNYHFIPG